jgi:hypothetical protein
MTEKEEVLVRVGELVREEQKDGARFERVARGDVDAAELAQLEVVASSDPEIAIRLEASRPLDPKAVDRIAARIGGAPKAAEVIPRPLAARPASPWKRWITLGAGPLALAVAMLVYVTTQSGPTGPVLPDYSVTVTGDQAMRSRTEVSTRLRLAKGAARDARFEVVVRPATAPQRKVVAYAFTFAAAGAEPAPLEAKVEIAPEGSVRFTGPARALETARELRIVVGEPSAIGRFDDAAGRAAANESSARVHVITVPIDRE